MARRSFRIDLVTTAWLMLVALSSAGIAAAQLGTFDTPMTFEVVGNGGNCTGCSWIAAVGVIDETTPQRLESFLATLPAGDAVVVLHSPGGSLVAGLQLGLVIRQHGLNTAVGETIRDGMYYATRPGQCLSA